jgi:hypothetical protein
MPNDPLEEFAANLIAERKRFWEGFMSEDETWANNVTGRKSPDPKSSDIRPGGTPSDTAGTDGAGSGAAANGIRPTLPRQPNDNSPSAGSNTAK